MSHAFTVVELLICVGVLIALVAMILPSVRGTMDRAQTTKCVGNQRQVISALLMYAGENDGRLPAYGNSEGGLNWTDDVRPYLGLRSNQYVGYNCLRCPAAKPSVTTTLGVNYAEIAAVAPFGIEGGGFPGSMRLSKVSSRTVLLADIDCPAGHTWFLSPNQFPLNKDSDEDGILDSRSGGGNYFKFRHNKTAVCSFTDGSARQVTTAEWGKNEGNLWGP